MAIGNFKIKNNLFEGVTDAIEFTTNTGSFEDLYIMNNSFYDCDEAIKVTSGSGTVTLTQIVNNTMNGNSGTTGIITQNHNGGAIDKNDIYGYTSRTSLNGSITESNPITTDPLFASPPSDLQLQNGSPCLDSGAVIATYPEIPTDDYLGNARPDGAGTDVGAYEMPPFSHSVDFFSGANGSITGDTTQTIADGADSTAVTAVPDANYNFTAWSGDNTSTDNPLTLTNVTADKDTTANFAIDTYSVNFSAGDDGSLTGDTTQTVNHGASSTTVTAVPDAGAAFTAWSGDNTSTDNPLTLTNVTADKDTTANFTVNTYTVTFVVDHARRGELVGSTSQTVAHGGSTTEVRADALKGYDFSTWSGGNTSTTNPLTLSNVTANTTVQANFVREFNKGKMLAGSRGGANITFDPSDGTNFSPARFSTRGKIPYTWNFPG